MLFHVTVLVCAFESIWYRLAAWGQGCEWIQVAPCASRSKSDRRPSRIKPSFQGVQSKKRLLQGILCLEPLTGMRHAKTNLYSHFEKENFKRLVSTRLVSTLLIVWNPVPCSPALPRYLNTSLENFSSENTWCLRLQTEYNWMQDPLQNC